MAEVAEAPAQEISGADVEALKSSMAQAFRHENTPTIQRSPETKVVTETTPPQPNPKPTEPKPEDKGGIKGMRAELDKAHAELKEFKAKMPEYEGVKTEYQKLQEAHAKREEDYKAVTEERDKYKKLESVSALEQSPEFQAKYVQGRETMVMQLQQLAEYAGVPKEDLFAAIGKTGKDRYTALDDLVSSAPSILKDDLLNHIKSLDALDYERHQQLSNADKVMQERLRERETVDRRTREEKAKTRAEAWEKTAPELAKELGLSEDDLKTASEFFKSNRDPVKAAQAAVRAQAIPALQKRLTEALEEIAGYQGAAPGLRAGKPNTGGDDKRFEGMTLAQQMNEKYKEMAKE